MTRFQIENTQSGTILGQYDADTEAQALDLMAQDAGYRDYADACAVTGADPEAWEDDLSVAPIGVDTLDDYTMVARDSRGVMISEDHGRYFDGDAETQRMRVDARSMLSRCKAASVVVYQTVSGEKAGKTVAVHSDDE
ncbi:hypothetical protein [Gemmatimonas sp.]|uniref:hypothetical protein n=1 Tax=Gemmatimonas sp. TaxID=1962908 RepID=UPI00334033B7